MTRWNVLSVATLALLIAGLAIDRAATNRQLSDLRHKYGLIAEAAAHEGQSPSSAPREETISADQLAGAQRLARRLLAAQNAAASAEPAEVPPSATAESESNSAAAPEPPSWSDQMARVDTVFSEEATDRSWSRDAETQLGSSLSPLAVGGARIQEVSCRSTLCRVKVEHTSEEAVRDLLNATFALRRSWKGAVATMRDADSPPGTFSGVAFFSRDGHDLPFAEE